MILIVCCCSGKILVCLIDLLVNYITIASVAILEL